MGWGALVAIGISAEQAYFSKHPNSFGRYLTGGGNLFILGQWLSEPNEGQRLGDLQIQETVEGAPVNRCIGPECRVAGTIVWMSDLREVRNTEYSGGKAGSGGEFITYQYFAHVALKFCRAKTPISAIPQLWADGKQFYSADTGANISASNIVAARETVTYQQGAAFQTRNYLVLSSTVTDFSGVRAGTIANVSGFSGGTVISTLALVSTPTIGTTVVQIRSTSGGTASLLVDDLLEFEGGGTYTVAANATVATGAGGTPVSVKNTITFFRPSIGLPGVTARRGATINNGAFMVVSSNSAPGTSQVKMIDLFSPGGTLATGNPFRAFAAVSAGPTISVKQTQPSFKSSQVKEIHFLKGGPDQAANAVMAEVETTITQLYALKNYAAIVLEDLNLTDFGNRVGSFEALVQERPEPAPVADAIRLILEDDASIPSSQIDTSLVSGTVRGYVVRGPQPPRRSLLGLVLAYDLVFWERGGVMFFASRSALTTTTIPVSELGARAVGDDARGRPLLVTDQSRDSLPSEVLVSYRSPTKEYQTATKRAKRTEELPVNVYNVDLGSMVLSDDDALRIGDRLLATAWGAQRALTVRLPQSRAGVVREGMILAFGPVYGQNWKMLVEKLDRGANMAIVASGREHDPEVLVQTGTTEGSLGLSATGNSQEGPNTQPAPLDLVLFDSPALSDQHRTEPGVYVAAAPYDATRVFRGGILYWSTDDGLSWKRVGLVPNEAVIGALVTPPSTIVVPDMWDRANTIRVKIKHPMAQLGSVTDDECVLGRNRFLIGREIVGVRNAVFVSRDAADQSKTYDLSMLLRGQHDTDQDMGAHVAGEAVVWLDGPGVQYVPLSFSHVDKPRIWKLVPYGSALDDVGAVEFTPSARNVKPYHVRDVRGTRDGSNNLTITWERTSRAARAFLSQGEPLDEEVEEYEVDVLHAGDVVRTIQVAGARTAAYTAAQHTTDGNTPGSPVTVRLYQMSRAFLRGQESEVTI